MIARRGVSRCSITVGKAQAALLGAWLISGWPKRTVSEATIMPQAMRAAHVWYYYVTVAH
jgi:hypothetical protein